MSDALDKINAATEALSLEETRSFNNVLIGALSASAIDPKVWDFAIGVASERYGKSPKESA